MLTVCAFIDIFAVRCFVKCFRFSFWAFLHNSRFYLFLYLINYKLTRVLVDFNIFSIYKLNKIMIHRHRQFQDVRSRSSSRSHSLYASSIWQRQKSQFQYPFPHSNHDDCLNCTNKKISESRAQHNKLLQQKQIREHLQNIKRINSMRDYQKQKRQKMLADALIYNKSSILQKQLSLKNIKKHEESLHLKQMEQKQQQYYKNQQDSKSSRKQLEQTYKKQLKSQLLQSRAIKQLTLSRIKSQTSTQINRLKVIEQNDQYVNAMKQQKKKCNRINKKLINQKSVLEYQEKQLNRKEELKHVQKVQRDFSKFSQFQPLNQSPYRKSRTILSAENNPQDVFSCLKRLESQKTITKITQRNINNVQRMTELKKLDQLNRQNVHKKLQSMRSYVDDLTNQLLEKRQKQRQSMYYQKYYQPEKSKADYYTQEKKSSVKSCNSCAKILEEKFF